MRPNFNTASPKINIPKPQGTTDEQTNTADPSTPQRQLSALVSPRGGSHREKAASVQPSDTNSASIRKREFHKAKKEPADPTSPRGKLVVSTTKRTSTLSSSLHPTTEQSQATDNRGVPAELIEEHTEPETSHTHFSEVMSRAQRPLPPLPSVPVTSLQQPMNLLFLSKTEEVPVAVEENSSDQDIYKIPTTAPRPTDELTSSEEEGPKVRVELAEFHPRAPIMESIPSVKPKELKPQSRKSVLPSQANSAKRVALSIKNLIGEYTEGSASQAARALNMLYIFSGEQSLLDADHHPEVAQFESLMSNLSAEDATTHLRALYRELRAYLSPIQQAAVERGFESAKPHYLGITWKYFGIEIKTQLNQLQPNN